MSCITASASSTGPIYAGPDLDTIVGSENSDFLEMNAGNFAEFILDEKLRIYGGDFVSGRTIEEEGLVYTTNIVQTAYAGEFADENSDINKGTFPLIGLFTEEYVSLSDDDAGELVKLLIDSDDRYTLGADSALELGEGYELTVKQIDVDGNKVWMELSKDGVFVEDEVIDITAGDATWDYDTNVGDQDDVIVFRALITEISQVDSLVVVEGLWLIDFQNVNEINVADEFGVMEVDSISDSLLIVNYEPINLLPDSVQEIAEGLKFKVLDDNLNLTFYLSKDADPIYPIADFTANTTFAISPLTVQFTDLSTNADSWEWDVDGDSIVDYIIKDPVHTYTSIGSYNVTLTAGNMNGSDTKTVNDYISIVVPRANVSIEPSSIPISGNLEPGDIFQVSVEVDCEEDNLRAIRLDVDYDSKSLQFNSANYEGLLGSDPLILSRSSEGTYSFDLAAPIETASPKQGTLLTLNFQVKAEASNGIYDLDLNDVILKDVNVATIPTMVNDGQVSVTNSSTLTEPTVRVVADMGPFAPGNEFQATIEVNSNGYSLNDVGLQLNYDPSAIIVTGITDEGLFGSNTMVEPGSGDNGTGLLTYDISATELNLLPISGDILTIDFMVKENATDGVYDLELENVLLKDENNTAIPDVLVSSTTFRVSNVSNVMPIVDIILPNDSDIISGLQNIEAVDLSGDEDVVSTAFRIYADTNGDGQVNDGNEWLSLGIDNNGSNGWNIAFLSNELPDGKYVLRVVMTDGSGVSYAYRSIEIYNADSPFSMAKVISKTGPFVPGQNFQATIKVISNGYPLKSIGLQLNYDPSAINFKGITDEGLLGNNTTVGTGIGGNNVIASVVYGVNVTEAINESISGNLFTIDFEVNENATEGTYSLNLENVVFRDENDTVIPDTVVFNTVILIANVSNTDPVDEKPGDEIPDEEEGITGIILQPGWNLISFPEYMDEPSIDDVLRAFSDDEIDIVFYDNANSGMMTVPSEFEPLKGYWVHNKMSGSVIIDENYLNPKIPSGPPSLRLYPGWNAIGHTVKIQLPAEYALITIDDFYTEVRGPWIPAEEDYAYVGYNNKEGIIGGNQVGTDVFSMNMYEGYYVFVENECVLA
ncbi:S-layer protein domain-containing protein [Methanolobus mangrovi]|uniref:S-layer protein domain-containing protein n=1 Tax=Methanolobus mangrovi TaxID=3072977 RepID=A0AA51UGY7_9EURY|nr:S-layer protein domain-containing protein [Methanolobus mangrovi]WMW22980.1 S-layer protein domain-containing protein [Methanolobus mangrovi]